MPRFGSDWRVVDGVVSAWFEGPSLVEGAALAESAVGLSAANTVDVRATGARVRLDSAEHAEAVSQVAHDLGLTANPAALQQLAVAFDTSDPVFVLPFWHRVLDYSPVGANGLVDRMRRDPALRFQVSTESRPFRNRIHVDVVRPAGAVERARPGEPSGPYGVCHTDPDGNEVDLVPGGPLGETTATADWQTVFSAMTVYRTTSPTQQVDLAATAATLANDCGFPLLIDLRPGLVILESGKDQWSDDAHGLELDFTDLAANIQSVAHQLGAVADSQLARFVQLFLDAADVAAVRAFWVAALGYIHDRRTELTDIHDPRRLNPVVVFQGLDAADNQRRQQHNRIHLELVVPSDIAQTRLSASITAGGRVVDQSHDRWLVADPEGNQLVIVSAA